MWGCASFVTGALSALICISLDFEGGESSGGKGTAAGTFFYLPDPLQRVVLPTVVSSGAIWTEIETGFHIELEAPVRINVLPD